MHLTGLQGLCVAPKHLEMLCSLSHPGSPGLPSPVFSLSLSSCFSIGFSFTLTPRPSNHWNPTLWFSLVSLCSCSLVSVFLSLAFILIISHAVSICLCLCLLIFIILDGSPLPFSWVRDFLCFVLDLFKPVTVSGAHFPLDFVDSH